MKDSLNPLTSKGRISYGPFVGSLALIGVFNLLVFGMMRSQLLPLRQAGDRDRLIVVYGVWLVLSLLGYAMAVNTMTKRWATVWEEDDCPGWLRSILRLALVSPIMSWVALGLTLLTSSKLGLFGGNVETPKRNAIFGWLVGVGLALAVVLYMTSVSSPVVGLGVAQSRFQHSLQHTAPGFTPGKNLFPPDRLTQAMMVIISPGLRYGLWIGMDFVRTRLIEKGIRELPNAFCRERLGFSGVEVPDCFFWNLRKTAAISPMVTPYFGLYNESLYRQELMRQETARADQMMVESHPQMKIAQTLLVISNQLELLETGPSFLDRRSLLEPSALLHFYASPEVPIVEAGQDLSRIVLKDKFLPLIEMQIGMMEGFLDSAERNLGPKIVDFRAQIRELRMRAEQLRRNPLLL